jgi:hypothetical protein
MKVILLDRSTAKELLDAIGNEWLNRYNGSERVERLLFLSRSLVDDTVGDRDDRFGRSFRLESRPDLHRSVRIVSVPDDDAEELKGIANAEPEDVRATDHR